MSKHIYKVHFNEPQRGKHDHYFTSLAAIYTVFKPEEIGCQVANLWNNNVASGTPYISAKCRITKEGLTNKKQKYGNNI